MTKKVSVPLVCELASMAGSKHPIPIVIVDKARIAFNIVGSFGRAGICAQRRPRRCLQRQRSWNAALFAAIGEARGGKVTGPQRRGLRRAVARFVQASAWW